MAARITMTNIHTSTFSCARTSRRPSPLLASVQRTAAPRLAAAPNSLTLKLSSAEAPKPSPLSLPTMWRDIQGADDWEELLEPLHPLLRREIVRYGELVSACYKAFDLDPSSKRYLNCKYGKTAMLREVGMASAGYRITKYIYANPDIAIPTQSEACPSRWIGYVAVATDEAVARLGRRDVLVSFRGTVTSAEWMANLMSSLTPARLDPHNPDRTSSCRQQLLSEISKLLSLYRNEETSITLAGHSMGSSLAVLLGYDIAELGLNRSSSGQETPVTVYSYGGPRVGNPAFKSRCEELRVKVLRVVNVNDPVTKMPGVLLNENLFKVLWGKLGLPWSCSCYAHVGVELSLDFFKMMNPACVHDLDAYIGWLKSANAHKDIIESDLFGKFRQFFLSQSQRFESSGPDLVQSPRAKA
ncbi:hypothetical protein HPP92_009168 [Vanilla planifolia]|uniref:Fungal lipase-type domain-containing protein n=1 Tax=Vanilla planifolia TaxID=51239 RepID=A0A835R624_VANPL|nr:hypothetical protein HPP92_009168 [Vanilla planifolia]